MWWPPLSNSIKLYAEKGVIALPQDPIEIFYGYW